MEHINGGHCCSYTRDKLRLFVMELFGGPLDNLRYSSCGLKSPKCRNCHRYLFLCDHLRNIICESSVEAEEDLIVRTLAGREAIENRSSIFRTVRQKRWRRFEELM
jgi:hypothetical protein